jgi:O-antigen/teichoic acid export membrane protein
MTNMPDREDPSARSSTKTLAHDSMRTFIARLVALVLSVATGIVTAKWLGPSGKGVYSGTLMLVSIVMIAPAGIGTAIIYELTKRRRSLSDLLPAMGALLLWSCGLAWVGALAWGLLRGWSPVLTIFVAAVPCSVVLAWQGGLYIGIGRIRNLNVQSVVLALATLVAVGVAVIVLHGGAIAALAAWLACLYGAAFVVVWHALKLGRGQSRAPLVPTMRGLVRFGGLSSVNLLLGTINYRIDSIILISILGIASFGIYSIAVNFGELLFTLTRPVTAAVTRDIGVRDAMDSALITAKVIRTCAVIAAAASVIALVFGPWAIDTVYGTRFHDAATPLRILVPGIVAFSTAGTFAAFFIVQAGKPVIISIINIAMIVVQAAMCFALVPRFGMNGAALASTVTYVAGALMNTAWFCRMTGVRFWDVWIVRPSDVQAVCAALREMRGFQTRRVSASAARAATGSDGP